MKKEYLILIGAILILCAYLFFHKENRDYYALPQIPKIDVQNISGFTIEKAGETIVFSKTETGWTLTPQAFVADPFLVDNMLAVFKSFKLNTLVSQQGTMERYELDASQGIQVKLMQDDKTLFAVTIGKTALTFNHTFVKLSDNNNVYHAVGSFRSHFEKSVADYRDKKVMVFKPDAINQLSISKDGLAQTLAATRVKGEKDKNTTTWKDKSGEAADKTAISEILSALSSLTCEKFIDTPAAAFKRNATSLGQISLKGTTDLELSLFEIEDGNGVAGISSMNTYAFVLDKNSSEQIISNIEKLLGIETTEEPE